jgi:hypothetical protein
MRKSAAITLLILGALTFALGMMWLLQMRLDRGDVYPPSSSLRSDPLGTMAFYESLAGLPGLTVARDFSANDNLPETPNTVYLHLGANADDWSDVPGDSFGEIQKFLARGGRLVVVFKPMLGDFLPGDEPDAATTDKSSKPAKPGAKKSTDNDDPDATVLLKDQWGVEFKFAEVLSDDSNPSVTATNVSGLALPARLEWHSGLYFANLDPAWQKIYAQDRDAVVIERHFGPGTVVMATDGYFLSNEAMRLDRHVNLLSWLLGPGHNVVFDEAHFGIVEDPGVAALIRRYHLAGLVGAFALLALLFIWKNSTSLVPPLAAEKGAGDVLGRDAATGFVNLLRRNIPAGELLEKCFAEWKKSPAAARPGVKVAEVQAVLDAEKVLPPRQRDPVQAYARVVALLKRPAFTPPPPVLAKPPSTP